VRSFAKEIFIVLFEHCGHNSLLKGLTALAAPSSWVHARPRPGKKQRVMARAHFLPSDGRIAPHKFGRKAIATTSCVQAVAITFHQTIVSFGWLQDGWMETL
jgi:hypothetical protein